MTTLKPGSIVSTSRAIVIEAEPSGGRVFALLPDNDVTPWVIWSSHSAETGDCTSGDYYYADQFSEACHTWNNKSTGIRWD